MYRRNQSGQFLYFGMVSLASGIGLTGIASSVSGRKSFDGGAFSLLSGPISEVGAGLYVANLYDFDINGNAVGFAFTASGCAPAFFSVTTTANGSGQLFLSSGQAVSLNSGQSTLTYSGQLSGQVINLLSGNQVQVWSGTQVNLFSGQLSGQQVTTLTNLDKSGYALSSGGIADLSANTLQRNLSGVQAGAHVNSLATAALKLVGRFNSLSGTTHDTAGNVKMTQARVTASGILPTVELGLGV